MPQEYWLLKSDNKGIFFAYYTYFNIPQEKVQFLKLLGNDWGSGVSPAALYYAQRWNPKLC